MKLELQYLNSCKRLANLFSQFSLVIKEIKIESETYKSNDPELTMSIIDNRLQLITDYENMFSAFGNKIRNDWDVKRNISYAIGHMDSFFRVFDNPFISVIQYYKVVELLESLVRVTNELELLLNDES